MKIIITCAAICALIALSAATEYYPGREGKCDYRCADIEVPVCASNGRCYQKFQSKCFMDHYNCINKDKFILTRDLMPCGKFERKCNMFPNIYRDAKIAGRKL